MSWARISRGAGPGRFHRLAPARPRPARPAPDTSSLPALILMLHQAGLMSDGCFGLIRRGECLLLFPDLRAACAFVCASVRGAAASGRSHEAQWGVARLRGACAGRVVIAFPARTVDTVAVWVAGGLAPHGS